MTHGDLHTLDVSTLPWIALSAYKTLPASSAIYFVLAADGAVLYIGRTSSLAQRWPAHHRLAQFVAMPDMRIAWLRIDDAAVLPRMEKALIETFAPPYNGASLPPALLKFVGFRVPEDLYALLLELAKRDSRSVTSELQALIRKAAIEEGLLPPRPEKGSV